MTFLSRRTSQAVCDSFWRLEARHRQIIRCLLAGIWYSPTMRHWLLRQYRRCCRDTTATLRHFTPAPCQPDAARPRFWWWWRGIFAYAGQSRNMVSERPAISGIHASMMEAISWRWFISACSGILDDSLRWDYRRRAGRNEDRGHGIVPGWRIDIISRLPVEERRWCRYYFTAPLSATALRHCHYIIRDGICFLVDGNAIAHQTNYIFCLAHYWRDIFVMMHTILFLF